MKRVINFNRIWQNALDVGHAIQMLVTREGGVYVVVVEKE